MLSVNVLFRGVLLRTVFAILSLSMAVLVLVSGASATLAQTTPELNALNTKALTILQANCGNSGCHGGSDPYSFDVKDPASLLAARVVESGDAAASELISRLEAGAMPMGGYKGQAGAKLPAADIQTLRQWIDAGGPASSKRVKQVQRPFIAESETLHAIIRDLETVRASDRLFLRYYSLANLWNSADVELTELGLHRAALGKLVNHLSWEREIVQPKQLGPQNTVLRVDLRDYGWTTDTWRQIVALYPYGLEPRNLFDEINRIQNLSGVGLPYIRVDWFITTASRAPLYHTILRLPDTVQGLESLIGVNTDWGVQRGLARRFGVRNSGVSRNNRAMERHATINGGYWKSFDFAGNNAEQNIFRDPLDLRADGGEMIFHLPNGLQAYFIADRQGKRIDDAPVNIVRDRTNPEDPVVHNGRSCIGCHVKGMNAFRDEISATLQARTEALFNLDIANTLYPGQSELDRLIEQDNKRFLDALGRAGGIPKGNDDEPISNLARKYEGTLTVDQAAADLFIQDPAKLQELIGRSAELRLQGFDQLLGPKGGIKRDSWEQGFEMVARELGVGDFLSPVNTFRVTRGADGRLTVLVGKLSGPAEMSNRMRQQLLFWLNQSDQVRLVQTGRADFNLTGTLAMRDRGQMTIRVEDAGRGIVAESWGAADDLDFLAQQVANRLNFQIGSAWLPVATTSFNSVPGDWNRIDPVSQLLSGLQANATGRLVLTTDLGPGATYRSGQDVIISFRSVANWFVTVFSVDAGGKVERLFPAAGATPSRAIANQVVRLVDFNGRSIARIDPNGVFGLETLVAVASPSPDAIGNTSATTWDAFSRSLRSNGAWSSSAPGAGRGSAPARDIAVLRFFTVP